MLSTTTNTSSERVGILWRGERGAERLSERANTVLGPLCYGDVTGIGTPRAGFIAALRH
jgi:hypothetical protein